MSDKPVNDAQFSDSNQTIDASIIPMIDEGKTEISEADIEYIKDFDIPNPPRTPGQDGLTKNPIKHAIFDVINSLLADQDEKSKAYVVSVLAQIDNIADLLQLQKTVCNALIYVCEQSDVVIIKTTINAQLEKFQVEIPITLGGIYNREEYQAMAAMLLARISAMKSNLNVALSAKADLDRTIEKQIEEANVRRGIIEELQKPLPSFDNPVVLMRKVIKRDKKTKVETVHYRFIGLEDSPDGSEAIGVVLALSMAERYPDVATAIAELTRLYKKKKPINNIAKYNPVIMHYASPVISSYISPEEFNDFAAARQEAMAKQAILDKTKK